MNQIIDEPANYISEYDIFDHYLIGNAIFIFITLNSIPLFSPFHIQARYLKLQRQHNE